MLFQIVLIAPFLGGWEVMVVHSVNCNFSWLLLMMDLSLQCFVISFIVSLFWVGFADFCETTCILDCKMSLQRVFVIASSRHSHNMTRQGPVFTLISWLGSGWPIPVGQFLKPNSCVEQVQGFKFSNSQDRLFPQRETNEFSVSFCWGGWGILAFSIFFPFLFNQYSALMFQALALCVSLISTPILFRLKALSTVAIKTQVPRVMKIQFWGQIEHQFTC